MLRLIPFVQKQIEFDIPFPVCFLKFPQISLFYPPEIIMFVVGSESKRQKKNSFCCCSSSFQVWSVTFFLGVRPVTSVSKISVKDSWSY